MSQWPWARWHRLLLIGAAASTAGAIPAPAAVTFTDVTTDAGVSYVQHVGNTNEANCLIEALDPLPPEITEDPELLAKIPDFLCMPERFSGGAAVADVDGDGWTDLFVTRLDAPDILFRNEGDDTFEDFSATSGLASFDLQSNGAVFADVDEDGDPDLYVTTIGDARFYLFINDGNGHFTEEAVARGAAVATPEQHIGFSVAVGDYDRDGYLDLFTTEWRAAGFLDEAAPSHARLLHNRGAAAPGHFDDVTVAAGIAMDGLTPLGTEFSWAPSFVDLDGDYWLDLAVVADASTSRLFWNDQDGTFTDGTVTSGVGTDENGMGSTFADWNGDGRLDWFVSSIYCDSQPEDCSGHRLYQNEGNRSFSDQTDAAGVRYGNSGIGFEVGWGSAFFDYDNDGDPDLLMTNGVSFVDGGAASGDANRLWRNDGVGPMPDVAASVALNDVGDGKGVLTFDYDDDGDLDLFIVNNASTPVLYRNDGGNQNDWLRVAAKGLHTNESGVGAEVTVEPVLGGPSQVQQIGVGTHFLGQSENVSHFGLGPGPGAPVAKVTVQFPGGRRQKYFNVARNTTLLAKETAARGCGITGVEALLPLVWLLLRRRRGSQAR